MIASKLCSNENPRESRSLGFFIPLWYGGLFHRLITDYLFLSNHLQMRWQVTPAATVTKKDMTISICSPPPVAGYRLDNTVSITYLLSFLKYKQFLKVYKIILGLFEYIILKSSALFQTSILSLNLADCFLVLYTQINPVF